MRKIADDQKAIADKVNQACGRSQKIMKKRRQQKSLLLGALALSLALPVTANALNVEIGDGGVLTVRGSADRDWITLTGNGAGSVEVRSGRRATTVEGAFTNVSDIVVRARGGKNQVSFSNVQVSGGVEVRAGSGNDAVNFGGQFGAGGDLVVDLNGGNNTVKMEAEASLMVGGSAIFEGNKGNDRLTLRSIATGRYLTIGASAGDDKIVLGEKNSYLVSVGRRLTISGGRGNNTINVFGAQVSSAIRLMSDRDVDRYSIHGTSSGSFFDVKSGGGNDRIVSRNNSVAEDYRIHCGGGSDSVASRNDTASELVQQRCGD